MNRVTGGVSIDYHNSIIFIFIQLMGFYFNASVIELCLIFRFSLFLSPSPNPRLPDDVDYTVIWYEWFAAWGFSSSFNQIIWASLIFYAMLYFIIIRTYVPIERANSNATICLCANLNFYTIDFCVFFNSSFSNERSIFKQLIRFFY